MITDITFDLIEKLEKLIELLRTALSGYVRDGDLAESFGPVLDYIVEILESLSYFTTFLLTELL